MDRHLSTRQLALLSTLKHRTLPSAANHVCVGCLQTPNHPLGCSLKLIALL